MNVKQLIAALQLLPEDAEIQVEASGGNSIDDQIDVWYTPSFEIVHSWRDIYRLEAL